MTLFCGIQKKIFCPSQWGTILFLVHFFSMYEKKNSLNFIQNILICVAEEKAKHKGLKRDEGG